MITSNIQKSPGKGSCWIIDSVIDHNINIAKYNPLTGSSYIKLPKELNHPKKGVINIQSVDDHECFKLCLVKYLHPANHHAVLISKVDRLFRDELDFKSIKF